MKIKIQVLENTPPITMVGEILLQGQEKGGQEFIKIRGKILESRDQREETTITFYRPVCRWWFDPEIFSN
jgi:hypothetical protein